MNTPQHRVAIFSTNFVPYSQTFIYEQAKRHKRYAAEVFCWRRLNADRFPFTPVHVAGPLYGLSTWSPHFHRILGRRPFDLVHAHFGTGAIYAAPYARRHDLPLVVTFHGYDVPLLWNIRRFHPAYWPFALGARAMLRQMTLGLCDSGELRELLLAEGVPEEKLRVHKLGIDIDDFQPAAPRARATRLIAVGRFVEKKGFEYVIRAFAPHAKAHPQLRLALIGDGPRRARLQAWVERLGLGAQVDFLGVLPAAQVREQLRQSDILLAPSVIAKDGDRDSGLLVAKEASAAGLPVLATVHGGLPEIVEHGVTGFLAPERDVGTLSAHLATLLADDALRQRMGAAARAKMLREYNADDVRDRLEAHYDDALALFSGGHNASATRHSTSANSSPRHDARSGHQASEGARGPAPACSA
ncbi:MAG: glycosyltransferase [Polyangiales bacterium]